MKIPVIINNRNLLTWPKAMFERIQRYDNVGSVFILDNDSTYSPLLEWYSTIPDNVLRISNMGHSAPWSSGLVRDIDSEYYIVTDPDLGLESTPDNTINHLMDKMNELNLNKVGLGLNWEIVKNDAIYYQWMQCHEKARWTNSRLESDIAIDVPIDTTFALYKTKDYFIGGGSTMSPYTARHYPWELSKDDVMNNEEFMFYLNNATNSSSFKWFTNL